MGKATVEIKEVRFIFEDELTQVYVLTEGYGDVPHVVTGWHHKTFPASMSVLAIIEEQRSGRDHPVLWPLEAPKATS